MSKLDDFIDDIKLQQKQFSQLSSSGADTKHDTWPQYYAAMWIEGLANAVKATLESPQRLTQTVSQDKPSKNATNKESL